MGELGPCDRVGDAVLALLSIDIRERPLVDEGLKGRSPGKLDDLGGGPGGWSCIVLLLPMFFEEEREDPGLVIVEDNTSMEIASIVGSEEDFARKGLSAKTHSAPFARTQPSQEPPSGLPEHFILRLLHRLHCNLVRRCQVSIGGGRKDSRRLLSSCEEVRGRDRSYWTRCLSCSRMGHDRPCRKSDLEWGKTERKPLTGPWGQGEGN